MFCFSQCTSLILEGWLLIMDCLVPALCRKNTHILILLASKLPIRLLPFSPLPGPQLHFCYPKQSTLMIVQKLTYRNHPVGQVTVLRHLHSSKHCQINMASGNRKCVISISCSSNSPQILISFCSFSLHQFKNGGIWQR